MEAFEWEEREEGTPFTTHMIGIDTDLYSWFLCRHQLAPINDPS